MVIYLYLSVFKIDVILINDDEIEMIPNLGIEVYDNNLIDLQKIIEYLKFMGF
jgi:hypothetical protein